MASLKTPATTFTEVEEAPGYSGAVNAPIGLSVGHIVTRMNLVKFCLPAGTGDSSLEDVLFPYDPKKKFSPNGNSTLHFLV